MGFNTFQLKLLALMFLVIDHIKTPGAGDYLNILGYGSALGQDVYVTREDYEVAIEIAKEFKTTDSKDLGRIRRIRQIFAIIILLGFVVGFVLTFIF